MDYSPDAFQGKKRCLPFIVAGSLIALVLPILLGLLAYLLIALDLPAGILPLAEWVAPLLGVACGALVAGAAPVRRPWRCGLLLGLGMVALWVLAWCFLQARWQVMGWWREGLPNLNGQHLLAWGLALLTGLVAGAAGAWLHRRHEVMTAFAILLLVFPAVLLIVGLASPRPAVTERELAPGVHLHIEPFSADGTALHLVSVDFSRNPALTLEAFDADLADATPGDNRNTTWLGLPLPIALPHIRMEARRKRERVLCAWNGDYFDFNRRWLGRHLSPLVVNGQAHYPVHNLHFHDQDWQFGFHHVQGRPQFVLEKDWPWSRWQTDFETAVGGVRPLRVNGQSLPLAPGNGNTHLRCARTSLGWSADSSCLYILVIQDLDGEMDSNRQKNHDPRQTGGWDLLQLQQYWERLHVPNAITLDGGDFTQFTYHANGRDQFLRSGYLASYTLGYLRQRPIRAFLPILPPEQDHVGAMNYLYLASK